MPQGSGRGDQSMVDLETRTTSTRNGPDLLHTVLEPFWKYEHAISSSREDMN